MKSTWIRRLAFVLLAVPTLVLAGHGLASAADEQGPVLIEDMNEPVVVLTGWLQVPEDVTVDDAVIFNGNATIAGHVTGTVLAFNGDVTITGTVDGDVASISGRVIVEDGAVVNGSITSQQPADISPGAEVGGSVTENQFNVDVVFIGRVAFWLAASVASLLFGLLLILFAPRAAEATATAARRRVGPSVGFGFLLFLGIPVLGVHRLGHDRGCLVRGGRAYRHGDALPRRLRRRRPQPGEAPAQGAARTRARLPAGVDHPSRDGARARARRVPLRRRCGLGLRCPRGGGVQGRTGSSVTGELGPGADHAAPGTAISAPPPIPPAP